MLVRALALCALCAAASSEPVPLTLLPQDKGDESPACLDGSPFGLYFVKSKTGSTKWTISIEGGGWCYDEQLCYKRSLTRLGSSKQFPPTGGCGCMNTVNGTIDGDCNCVFLPYCDGASFSGYRAKPLAVPGMPGKTITTRGIKNLDAALDFAVAHGLKDATEFVLTGGSAGGLSTYLHADRAAARVAQVAPGCKKIRAAPVVGYFLDHDNFRHTHGVPNTPTWGGENYTYWMKYIYTMQNLTFGPDGGLMPACRQIYPNEPFKCFMAPHMVSVIKTPVFAFNSRFDSWQLANELQTTWETKAEQAAVVQYGKDFLSQLHTLQSSPKNGAFITTCICHGCPWQSLTLSPGAKNAYQLYAAWMAGETMGAESIHIDYRMPNGGGAIKSSQCKPFP